MLGIVYFCSVLKENEEFASQRSDAIQEAGKGELKKFGGSKQIASSRFDHNLIITVHT